MKITILLLTILVLAGCKKKEEGPSQQELDHQDIEAYVTKNGLTGQFTASGLYYVINVPGDAVKPVYNSIITVTYKGYYLDGTVLDEGSYYTERLVLLIKGWQEGIPKIGRGGSIKMILPSHLAYGNGVLVFDVTLHDFQ